MSVIHQPKQPELDFRLMLFPVVGAAGLMALFLRLWYIQVVEAPALVEKAEASRETRIEKLAPRGLMYDRRGVLVAGIKPEIVVTAIPNEIKKHPEVLSKVAQFLNVDVKRLQDKVDDNTWRPYLAAPIFVGATVAQGVKIAESAEVLPGIAVDSQPMRYYPDSVSFTHVLGSVRVPTAEDVDRIREKGQEPAEYVGRDGIERAYELDLMGSAGAERMEVDARRRPVRVVGRDAATPGSKLVLTLDSRLQKTATKLLGGKGTPGAIVALDPKSGEILCLVSSPTFDQNLFQGGISNTEWKALQNHEGKPMLNRAIYASYSPGSTFKMVTALAAKEAGIFDPNQTIFCAGGYRLGRRFAKCLGHHGAISFARAMEKSCNTYFYTLAMRAGEENLRKASLEMGLGQRTGLEILGEGRGIVPTDEWIKKHRDPPVWRGGDTLNFGIGQGELRTTPIQMANVVAMVANSGVNYKPHLVKKIVTTTGSESAAVQPEVAHQVNEPPEFWRSVQDSLCRVIEGGTARVAQIPGLRWGGKTGSTEHGKGKKTHGWFVGFAPADNPKIAIAVLVEAAGHGGEVAAPLARDVVKAYLMAPPKADASSSAVSASASRPKAR